MKQFLRTIMISVALVGGMAATTLSPLTAYAETKCSVLPADWCSAPKDGSNGITELLKLVLRVMTALVGVVAVGVFVYAGILYAGADAKADQVAKAKNVILQAVIGLALYGLMFIVLQWLIPGGIL